MSINNSVKMVALCGFVFLAACCLIAYTSTNVAYGQDGEKGATAQENGYPASIGDTIEQQCSHGVAVTRWVDPEGRTPISYVEWKARAGVRGPFQIKLAAESSRPKSTANGTKFCVVINSSLYSQIQSSIDLYVLDLTGEGYDVEVYTTSGGTPEDLRTFLQGRYSSGMEGCVLIGDLPVAWYEAECWDPPEHEEFPTDLFYMDMDGAFTDSDMDGKYDSHTGHVAPEIWLGRLTASPLTMGGADEVSLLQNYFYKNHIYRSGLLPLNNRSLVYIDDDWVPSSAWWNLSVGGAYGERTFVNDEWTTWAPDYESRLPQNYEFIQVCAHSWPGGHSFKKPYEQWSYTYNSEVIAIDPIAYFYNLFACSNARYVETDYMAGWYAFCNTYGLAALGSTKSGSMLYFSDFYRPFGEGETIGEAFLDWFVARAADGFEDWEVCWFYGMTLIGDPTLVLREKSTSRLVQYDDGNDQYMISLPNAYGRDLYNVRFTAAEACTLTVAGIRGCFPGAPGARVYVWESDGTYPTTLVDSVDIPQGTLPIYGTIVADFSGKNITFQKNEDFHIGVNILSPGPGDTLWIYMDDGQPETEHRSSLYRDGSWHTLYDYWGQDYNFLIRAVVQYPSEPAVTITTTSLPEVEVGETYNQVVEATGGLLPYSWDITAGDLPDGLSLNPSTGEISGTPTASGTFNFTIRVTDSDSPSLTDIQHLSIFSTFCIDADGDGYGDPGHPENTCPDDNCPTVYNPDQSDGEGDGVGDSCDNCIYVCNPEQEDSDSDGMGDSCDVCTDTDGDGFGNPGFPANTCALDNCPDTANPSQADTDNNGVGDACCCQDRGNVDDILGVGGPIDVSDLTYLVAYLFTGGLTPPCPEQANVDGIVGVGGPIDVSDLTYLVTYLFKLGSPPPLCP